ncbi:MAG TPA: phosphate acetyltransferase [Elusimicrobia bacterium]|nr:phosphate acetyltransferase [Elusimicrobiota bacterium]
MDISTTLRQKATLSPARLLLPEGSDSRVREAAVKASELGVCHPIIMLAAGEGDGFRADGVEIVDPCSAEIINRGASVWSGRKNIQILAALPLMDNRLSLAAALLNDNFAESMVAGAAHATADVLRPVLELRKLYPGISPVVSCFLMELPDKSFGENGIMVFADCGMNPDPSDGMLAQIAGSAAKAARDILGLEPRVALLSFSSKGSAEHPSVLKVRRALEIARQKFPDLVIDGELQADAALIPWIGEKKAPGSPVAGRANVLVFPDLNSGNIAYKLVERLAGGKAVGPVVLGLNPPVNDLSRGCSVEDIVDMCAVASIQAGLAPRSTT